MKIFTNNLQLIFKLSNICLVILYLFPGSILGFLLYNDFNRQPQITGDFFYISSNHISTYPTFQCPPKPFITCGMQ